MRSALLLLPFTALLTACSGDDAPTGQVLATVNGTEITSAELNAELNGIRAGNPAEQRELQRAALQSIVNRTLLAQAAEEQGVDDSPMGAMAKRRAEQMATISLYEQQVRGRVPQVSAEEAEQFITDNPAMFGQRRIFLVDQIIVPSPPQALLRALEPLDTMTQVQAELARYNLPTRSTFGVIDAVTMNPSAVRQIVALAPDAVFILPAQGSIRINRIRESQVQPITGPDAVAVATEMLRNQRTEQQLNEAVSGIIQRGQANVRYNPEYQPRPAPRAPGAATNARPAAPTTPPAE
jgi:EpsD family peptidyl-prolyl cis-trans isomerase